MSNLIMVLAVVAAVFLIIRRFWWWYFGIDRMIAALERIADRGVEQPRVVADTRSYADALQEHLNREIR